MKKTLVALMITASAILWPLAARANGPDVSVMIGLPLPFPHLIARGHAHREVASHDRGYDARHYPHHGYRGHHAHPGFNGHGHRARHGHHGGGHESQVYERRGSPRDHRSH